MAGVRERWRLGAPAAILPGMSSPFDPGPNPKPLSDPGIEGGDLAALVAGLFSPLAHDLRAGLNGISVWTHLLSRDADEVGMRALEGIRRAVSHQSTLAQELSQFGVALNAQRSQEPAAVDLVKLCEDVAAEVQSANPGRGVSVDAGAVGQVVTHAPLLRGVVRLLLLDAVAAAPEETAAVLSLREAQGTVALEVHASPRSDATGTPRRPTLRQALAALASCMLRGHLEVISSEGGGGCRLKLPAG
jgi:signal transduction histidine kinase